MQNYFHRRLKEAKEVVTEPPQPRVKLTMGAKSPEPPPKITLKFGNPKPGTSAGLSVDGEALKRQQDLVRAGVNGQRPNLASSGRPPSEKSASGSENGIVMNGIKREASHGYSAAGGSQPNGSTHSTMAPPVHNTPRIASGSPHPQPVHVNGIAASNSYASSTYNSYLRPPGKGRKHCPAQGI